MTHRILPSLRHRIVPALIVVLLSGCGGSGNDAAPGPASPLSVVFVSTPPTSLAVNAASTLVAATTYPSGTVGGNMAVTWTVTCGAANACGTFGPSDELGAVTYTAPSSIPSGKTVKVTATSVANPSLSASATITIVAPLPIAVSFAPTPPASIQVGAALPLTATVVNDVSSDPQVNWTVTCDAADCGSFQPSTTASGSATTYTAPAAIPGGGSVSVTATSVTDKTKLASVKIAVTAAASTLANGTYVFQLAAPPGNQATFVTGVLVASNGRITGGEQDSISYSTDPNGNPFGNPIFQPITGGTYATTADGNLQLSIALGPDGLETIEGTLGAGNRGFVAGLNGASVTGSLELQTSTAAPSGGYAISLFGGDGSQAPTWLAGVVNIDAPGGISGAGSILDVVDDGGEQTGTYTLGMSSVSAPDNQGRVQIQLQPNPSTLQPITLAGYIVDATHIRLIASGDTGDAANYQGVLGGLALGQGAGAGRFSTASVAGSSYVFGAQGDDAQGALQIAGVLTLSANGTVTGMLNWNDLSGHAARTAQSFTGTYTVDPTGRLTLTRLTDASTFTYSMQLYLAAGGNALLLSNDTADSFDGQGYLRQSTAFTAASFGGTYGLNATRFTPNTAGSGQLELPAVGTVSSAAGGNTDALSGFADAADGSADFALGGSVNAQPNGVFPATLAGFDPAAPAASGAFTLYVVDATRALLIETDTMGLALGNLQSAL
jgi:hypothetical protein